MLRSSPFGGPRLEQLAQLPAWQPAFLAAARAADCADYYLVDGYENPDHANAIGPATMHLLMAAADSAVPDVNDRALSDVGLQVAIARRTRKVQRRVVEAIVNEVETMHQRAVRHASQYLLAAIAPALHPTVHDASSPYHMWHQLREASRHGLQELYALYTRATTTTIDAPASVDCAQRGIIDPFLDAVLPPTTRPEWTAATTAAVAEYASETRAKLAMVLLTHAAADVVPDAATFAHDNWDVAEYMRFLETRIVQRAPPPLSLTPKDIAVTESIGAPEVPLRPDRTGSAVAPVVELVDVEPEIEVAPFVSIVNAPINVLEEAPTSAGNTAALDPVPPLEDEIVEPEVKSRSVDAAPLFVPAPPAVFVPPVVPALPGPVEPSHMTVTSLDTTPVIPSATNVCSSAFAPPRSDPDEHNASDDSEITSPPVDPAPLRNDPDEHNASDDSEITSPPVDPATPEPKAMPRLAVTPPSTPLVITTAPNVASAALPHIPNDVPALTVKTEFCVAPCEPAAEAIDLCSPASTPPPECASPLGSVEVKTELLASPAPIVPVRVTHVRRPSLSHAVAAPQPSRAPQPTSSESPVVTKIQGFKVTRIKITKPKASAAGKRRTSSTDHEPSAKRPMTIKTEPVLKTEIAP